MSKKAYEAEMESAEELARLIQPHPHRCRCGARARIYSEKTKQMVCCLCHQVTSLADLQNQIPAVK